MARFDKITELRVEHITKRFPGVLASADISLCVGEHQILALVGENGAGKTTLMNIMMNLLPEQKRTVITASPVKILMSLLLKPKRAVIVMNRVQALRI